MLHWNLRGCSNKFSRLLVNYAIIVTVSCIGKLKVMGNDCRINWIVFYNRRKAKLVSWCSGMMYFPVVCFTILRLYTFINWDLK